MPRSRMNLPNTLTLVRMFLVPLLVVVLLAAPLLLYLLLHIVYLPGVY